MNSYKNCVQWISKDSGLPQSLVAEVLESYENYAKFQVETTGTVFLHGIGRLTYSIIPAKHNVWNSILNKYVDYPESLSPCFKLSANIKNSLKYFRINNWDGSKSLKNQRSGATRVAKSKGRQVVGYRLPNYFDDYYSEPTNSNVLPNPFTNFGE